MKRLLRHFVVNTFALYVASLVASGLVFDKGVETILLSGAVLTAVSIFVRPIINLFLLPLNLVTFGLFRWVTSAIALYLVTLIVPGFAISVFQFAGYSSNWFDLPVISVGGLMSYIAFSFLISLVSSFMYWLIK